MLFRDVATKYLDWVKMARAELTHEYHRDRLKGFLKALGDRPAADVATVDLLPLCTCRANIVTIRRMYRWATKEAHLLHDNPAADIEVPSIGQRVRILPRKDLVRLMRNAWTDFRAFLLGMRETAARPQEIRVIQWLNLQQLDADQGLEGQLKAGKCFFVLTEFKGKKRRKDKTGTRIIPISPRLGRWLWRRWRRGKRKGLIFRSSKGRPWDKNSLRCCMRRLRVKAGLTIDRTGEKLCLYHLRHTTATNLAASGLQQQILAEVLGHASVVTTSRYLHLNQRHVMNQIARIWKEQKTGTE